MEIARRKWDIMPYIAVILGIGIIYMVTKMFLNRKPREHRVHHTQQHVPHHIQQHKQQQPVVRNRSQEWYEQKLKRDLAERMEAKKPKVQFNFKKRKDDYVAALQNKKKSADMSKPWVRKAVKQEAEPEVFTNNQDFSDPWKTSEEPKKEEEKQQKKGAFSMFD